jgi:hypothetical protein
MSDDSWEREKAFWDSVELDAYCLEYSGGYGGADEMVRQQPGPNDPGGEPGDWIRADDFRRIVENERDALRAKVAELEACAVASRNELTHERQEHALTRGGLGALVAELEAQLSTCQAGEREDALALRAKVAELESHIKRYAPSQERCTPAERRVLEAMARVPTEHLEAAVACDDPEEACVGIELCKAELARRKEEQ